MEPSLGWRLDPLTIAALAAYLAIYVWRLRDARRERSARGPGSNRGLEWWRAACFGLGIALLAIALLSPLDAAGEYLFSAHMLQHLLIGDLAPLLLLLGLSRVIMRPATRRLTSIERALGALANPLTALVAWVALLYVWHVPALYDAALASPPLHALEHASFFVGGLLLWWPLVQPVPMRRQAAGLWPFAYITGAKVAGGVLGLLLIWSSALVYERYASAPRITALTPLDDQKAGGAMMMTEQSIVLFAAFFVLFIAMLARSERDQLRRDRLEDERLAREHGDGGVPAPRPRGARH